jgi:hypothetical protein
MCFLPKRQLGKRSNDFYGPLITLSWLGRRVRVRREERTQMLAVLALERFVSRWNWIAQENVLPLSNGLASVFPMAGRLGTKVAADAFSYP